MLSLNKRRTYSAFVAIIFLLFLLISPLKFSLPAALPEVSYFPSSTLNWFYSSWPPILFPLSCAFFLLLLLPLVLMFTSQKRKIPLLFPSLWLLLALISLLGFLNSSTVDFAILQCAHLFGLASICIFLFYLVNEEIDLQSIILSGIFFSTAIISIIAFYQYFYGFNEIREFISQHEAKNAILLSGAIHNRLNQNLVYSTFALSNNLASHLILTIPIIIWTINKSKIFDLNIIKEFSFKHIITFIITVFLLFILFLTGSRAAIISLYLALVILVILLPFNKLTKLLITSLAIVLPLACLILFRYKGFDSLLIRIDYFKSALWMLLQHFTTGTGWGDFFHEYTRHKNFLSYESPHMPHNFPLSMGSQAGIMALILSIIILVSPIVMGAAKIIKYKRVDQTPSITLPLFLGWTAWSIHALVDINIQIPSTSLAAIAIMTLLVDSRIPSRKDAMAKTYDNNVTRNRINILILIIISAFFSIYFSYGRLKAEFFLAKLSNITNPIFNFENKNKLPPDMDQVNKLWQKSSRLIPYSPFPSAIAGDFALRQQKWEKAEEYFSFAIQRSPERAGFYYKIAVAQIKQNKRQKALTNIKKAINLFPYKYMKLIKTKNKGQ